LTWGESKLHEATVYFSARPESRAADTLRQASHPVDFHTFHNVSRDPSMCISTSISGLTVEISREHPETLTCAWATLPAKGLAFPLLMGGTATPEPLVNGEVYALSKGLEGQTSAWETIEESTHANRALLEARVEQLLGEGKKGEAAGLLDDWTRRTCDAQAAVLRLMGQQELRIEFNHGTHRTHGKWRNSLELRPLSVVGFSFFIFHFALPLPPLPIVGTLTVFP
jgi:hypothetical protein